MLSRIARGLYGMGRLVERAQNVVRILEVHHKMELEDALADDSPTWLAIFEAFGLPGDDPSESALYQHLVFQPDFPYSVRHCFDGAREEGRTKREYISEEMWAHLNGFFLSFDERCFEDVLRVGRSDFNTRIATFCDAFFGLANDTMIHRDEWHFLRLGRYLERAEMICRVLDIKRKSLLLTPEEEGRPIDGRQWQALLRSLSAFEPYRRRYDARIRPGRVLEMVLRAEDLPRSLQFSLSQVCESLTAIGTHDTPQLDLQVEAGQMVADLRQLDGEALLQDGLEGCIRRMSRRCARLSDSLDLAYFTSLHRVPHEPRTQFRGEQ